MIGAGWSRCVTGQADKATRRVSLRSVPRLVAGAGGLAVICCFALAFAFAGGAG
jgi:hypothetical protein